ncbi:hypothetical protein Tco_0246722 [Tanacetum coccineum]
MSDSEDSTVTYTAVSSPFGGLLDIGSLGVDGPPVMPEDPYAYVVAAFQAPPSPDYVSGLEYPPSLESPRWNPEEDDDEDPKEDHVDYPTDGGDDGDDKDESSDDNEDDDVDIEGDEEEEEGHPAPADSTDVARLLAIPTPPSSPLSPRSSPLPQLPSPPLPLILSPLPLSPPLPISSLSLPASPIYPLGYPSMRAMIQPPRQTEVTLPPRKRLGIALGPRYEVGESSSAPTARHPRGFRAGYSFVSTIDKEIMRDLERDVGYGITDTWDEMLVDMPVAPTTDDTEMGRWMTEFTTRVSQDTDEIYTRAIFDIERICDFSHIIDIEADDDEEEEEHPAPADSAVVALPAADQAPSAEETEPFETDESAVTPPPHPAYRVTARISIPAPVPTPVWSDAEVARLLAISTPPSSPLSPWSLPLP